MRRAVMALAWAILTLSLAALPAIAQSTATVSVDQIGDELEFRHYYIEEGAPITVNEMESLIGDHPDVYSLPSRTTIGDGADQLAADLLEVVRAGTW